MPRTILDVSRWQGRIDWDKVKAAGLVSGVMIRAMGNSKEGKPSKPYIDPFFARNYAECQRLGIPVGGYYYTCATTPQQTAAELAALRAALADKNFQLPIVVDAEDPKLRSLTPAKLSARVAEAAAQLEAWGLYAMVYTYTNFADTALDMAALAAYDLWIADYRGTRPTRKHGMWQYTSSGTIPGVSGPVDLSVAYKDYAGIIQRAGLGQVRGGDRCGNGSPNIGQSGLSVCWAPPSSRWSSSTRLCWTACWPSCMIVSIRRVSITSSRAALTLVD